MIEGSTGRAGLSDGVRSWAHRTRLGGFEQPTQSEWKPSLIALAVALLGPAALRFAIQVGPKSPEYQAHWWLLTALFFLAEVYVVQLRFRRDTHAVSLHEIPLILGLFFATPAGLVGGQLVGSAAALLVRRQRPLRLVTELVQIPLATSLAVIVFHGVAAVHVGMLPTLWLGALLGACAASLVGSLAAVGADSLRSGGRELGRLPSMAGFDLAVTLTNASVALIGIIILEADWVAVWLLLVPAAVLLTAYRAYASERRKHERMQFLYESGRVMQESQDPEAVTLALLRHALGMFRAERAEVILFGRTEHEPPVRTAVSPVSVEVMEPIGEDVTGRLAREFGPHGTARLIRDTGETGELAGYFRSRGLRDLLLAPLRSDLRVVGAILVANRKPEAGRFEPEDLQLLDTLGTQASASIENARLEAKLKHQAFHDSLTQLANRALFSDRVDHALAKRHLQTKLAVLFMDLDDFKTVNDSLGHIAGDQLLVAVAERLRACLRPQDTAARLGGDEFAILLEDVGDGEDAKRVAERIVEALRSPFIVQREEVVIHASIGIAMSRATTTRADDLLRQADEAMYTAKAQGKGRFEIFEPRMHVAVVERHELKADLMRRDFGTQTFSIYYQPIVRLENGEIVGVEALLRWQHPRRGIVSPNDFIGIAEETGLILPLGKWVMQKSARQVRRWQEKYAAHSRLGISVNLSARQLQQPALLEDIMGVLAQSDLEPSQLMLEITESVMMQDIDVSVARLRQLKQLGVRIAIDDFGTGYSSLSILQQVPADTLKIAKQFVEGVGQDSSREDFASAIIKLGETVHMDVVAEGIESVREAERLAQLGCQYGQGFLFSEPLKATQIDQHLSRVLSFGTSFASPPPEVIELPRTFRGAEEAG